MTCLKAPSPASLLFFVMILNMGTKLKKGIRSNGVISMRSEKQK
jgi:hypothetical protein